MELERFLGHPARLIERCPGAHAPGEVREIHPEITVIILADQTNVGSHQYTYLPVASRIPRPALDALYRPNREILFRMRHGNPPFPELVLQLNVAARSRDLVPSLRNEHPENFRARHMRI